MRHLWLKLWGYIPSHVQHFYDELNRPYTRIYYIASGGRHKTRIVEGHWPLEALQ